MTARETYPRMAQWAQGQIAPAAYFAAEILAALDEIDRLRHAVSEAPE